MNELIRITEHDGKKAVSARDLHEFLESKRDFSSWIKDRIKKYGLVENQDYVSLTNFGERTKKGGQNKIEYALTIDTAKELSMVEGNAKGKEARQYFIACEKQLKKPLTQVEIVAQSAQILLDHDKRINSVEDKVKTLIAQSKTRSDYFTIVGYASLNGMQCGIRLASSLGQKASRICKERGIVMESISDPRFGKVNTYPETVLEEVFSMSVV